MSWEMRSFRRFGVLSLLFVLVFTNFAWAIWVDADGSGKESINISTNTGNSGYPSLCLDTSRNPHITWEDNTTHDEIYYLKWNGTEWVDADGSGRESINISNTIGSSYRASFRLNSSGNPHIAWKDYTPGNYDIYYLKWNGTVWVDADGSGQESTNILNTSNDSFHPSLCLDNSGNPHIAWFDDISGNRDIYYLKWNGIAWVDADGSGQESINISTNTGNSRNPYLCLDSLGNPHIAWEDSSSGNYDIYYLKWNGAAWVDVDGSGKESIDILNSNGDSKNASLWLDSSDNPHIAWDRYFPGDHNIYYLKWNGTEWVDADGSGKESIDISNNRGRSAKPSLCLDRLGNPRIAWEDNSSGNYDIYYLKWNGTAWVDVDGSGKEAINVSNTSGGARVSSLYLDSSGNPHIAWCDNTSGNNEIYYLKWNNAPTLSWTGETNYTSDGLNPEAGYPNTDFVYRIKYTDQDNDSPASGYPKLHIMKGGAEISGSPFLMSEVDAGDTTYSDGKLYTYPKSGLALGTDYTYYFEAKDVWNTLATGDPTSPVDAPDVTNRAPTLSWTGETNYIDDGLNPESGNPNTTFFYMVKYTDQDNEAPATGYPKLYIMKGGLEVGVFTMDEVEPGDTDYTNGKLYTFSKSGLEPGTDYTYSFEAKDVWNALATGDPISPHYGPDVAPVGNRVPTLSWTGETDYTDDGLDPEAGYPNTDFVYRVKYTDQDNEAPTSGCPKVHIMKGGLEISGSPFTMNEVDAGDTTYSDGKLYTYSKSRLGPGTNYTYYFEAKDIWNSPATGEPINPVDAPDVTNLAPTLSWTGETDYADDGLNPEDAPSNVNFVYRVKYTDQDNDAPASGCPKLHIKKGGLEISGSPFAMNEVNAGDKTYNDGKLYTYAKSGLALGTDYTYYFEAKDVWNASATGAPTSPVDAPDVRLGLSAQGGVKIQGGKNGYVNPLKGEEAEIHFWPSAPGTVNVEIFDLIGLLVWNKSKDVTGAQDSIKWNCRNSENDLVASGIYVVYVKGPGIKATKKVAVMK